MGYIKKKKTLLVLLLTRSPISHQPWPDRPESIITSKATSHLGLSGLKLSAVAVIKTAIVYVQSYVAWDGKTRIRVSAKP